MAYFNEMFEWVEHHVGFTLLVVGGWVVLLVVSLWAGRHFLISIPPDYFHRGHKPLERWQDSHPALRWTLIIGKNLIGTLLIAAGIVMLFTPGQGILTLLLGISLVDIPGKQALERRLIERPAVLSFVNKLRASANQPPLELEPRGRSPGTGA